MKESLLVKNINKYLAKNVPTNPPTLRINEIIPNAATYSLFGMFL